jgi:hypothetical protein
MLMTWLLIAGAVDAVLIALAVRASRRPRAKRALRRLMFACVAMMAVSGAAGVIWWLGRTIAAVSNPSLEASQKARILAEGIAATMNASVVGVAFLLPSLVTIVLYVRAPEDGAPNDAVR